MKYLQSKKVARDLLDGKVKEGYVAAFIDEETGEFFAFTVHETHNDITLPPDSLTITWINGDSYIRTIVRTI